MSDIGTILKRLREENGFTGKEVVEKLKKIGIEISDKTLYGYESGRNSTNADMFLALCQVYKCQNIMETFSASVDDVLFTNKEWEHIEKYRSLDPCGQETVSYILDREVNRVNELADQKRRIEESEKSISADGHPVRVINYYYRLASAGTGQILFDMPPTKRIEIPDILEYRRADYAIGVNGNSMEPTYFDGDTLLVEMTDHIEVGEIGIFSVDNECHVKELAADELKSLNPTSKNIPLNETAHCMGRVIGKL